MKDKKRIFAVLAGIVCIVATASLMLLPMSMNESEQKNPYKQTIEQLESSEKRMLDLIAHEKQEFEQLREHVFSP